MNGLLPTAALLLLVCSAPPAYGQYHAGTGLPLEPWDLQCAPGQALAGVYTKRALAENEQYDWELSFLCWEVDNLAAVAVEESDCETLEPFELAGHVLVGDETVNCGAGRFITGIKGEFVEGKRMVQLHCCAPQNAEVDERIGCHTSSPVDIKNIPATGVETPYEHELTCPNWVAVGWEACDSGVKIKYCPFKVEGAEYDAKRCRRIRTTDTESCPTPYYQPWTVPCSPSQTIAGFSTVKLDAYGKSDYSFRWFCRDVDYSGNILVSESDCRWTDSPQPYELGIEQKDWQHPVNCLEGEYVSAVRSHWDEALAIRTMWFKCCKPQNAKPSRRIGCHSTEVTPTFSSLYSGAKSPYEPKLNCPRYAMTGVYGCDTGISLGFCPFEVEAVDYDPTCRSVRTTEFEQNPECPAAAVEIGQCPVIPFGECEKECDTHEQCKEKHGDKAYCCHNDCEHVCFFGVGCVMRECIGAGHCPVHCDRACARHFDRHHFERQWRRLVGWECRSLQKDDPYEQECCCFFESSDPNCSHDFDDV